MLPRISVCVAFLLAPLLVSASQEFHVSGKVLLQSNGPNMVVAFVEPDERGITHVVHVRSATPLAVGAISTVFERAEVIGRDRRFEIVDLNSGNTIVFTVDARGAGASARDLPRPRQGRRATEGDARPLVMVGYEVGYHVMPPGRLIASVQRHPAVAAEQCTPWLGGDDCAAGPVISTQSAREPVALGPGTCDGGGPGATSCSITSIEGRSCEVTCGTGYYACCKYAGPSCRCVVD